MVILTDKGIGRNIRGLRVTITMGRHLGMVVREGGGRSDSENVDEKVGDVQVDKSISRALAAYGARDCVHGVSKNTSPLKTAWRAIPLA